MLKKRETEERGKRSKLLIYDDYCDCNIKWYQKLGWWFKSCFKKTKE